MVFPSNLNYDGKSMMNEMFPRYRWLVQERRNSIANALELRLSCTNPSICVVHYMNPSVDNDVRYILSQVRARVLASR